jgi:hypothetical protein
MLKVILLVLVSEKIIVESPRIELHCWRDSSRIRQAAERAAQKPTTHLPLAHLLQQYNVFDASLTRDPKWARRGS